MVSDDNRYVNVMYIKTFFFIIIISDGCREEPVRTAHSGRRQLTANELRLFGEHNLEDHEGMEEDFLDRQLLGKEEAEKEESDLTRFGLTLSRKKTETMVFNGNADDTLAKCLVKLGDSDMVNSTESLNILASCYHLLNPRGSSNIALPPLLLFTDHRVKRRSGSPDS